MDLLTFTDRGIYCRPADVYVDPWKPVKKALITHGHSDHSRWGHQYYLCQDDSKTIIQHRLGKDINIESIPYNKIVTINGVRFSFHPAGHIIGSAQIRVEHKGEVWVASGDYKLEDDGLCIPFEPVACHAFITESTFGLPVYRWKPQAAVFEEINTWWRSNREKGLVSVLAGYALGKAQRIIQGLDSSIGTIFTHGAIENMNEVIRSAGFRLNDTVRVTKDQDKAIYRGGMVIATPSALASSWLKKFQPYSEAIASGWMQLRGPRRRRSVDRGFVLSDHADWDGLNTAIKETGAEKVIITHGYTNAFARWLKERGIEAMTEQTQFEGELSEISESAPGEEEAVS